MSTQTPITSAADARRHLEGLYAERAAATAHGLSGIQEYATDLDREIAATSSLFVGAAVTEIAILRGELSGRDQG